MAFLKWLGLQLFDGEGAGEGGTGAETGVNSADAGQARLLELGVPADKLRKPRAQKAATPLPAGAVKAAEAPAAKAEGQAAAAEKMEEPKPAKPAAKPTWDELMEDPEYNQQMQNAVRARLKTSKGAEEALQKLTPAIELLARKYKLDAASPDYDALAKAISEDDAYYEAQAEASGLPVEAARRIDQLERDAARRERAEQQTLEQQAARQHIARLAQQGEALRQTFPSFDIREELKNPAFARMTSPGVGISVEDAYYAVHRSEIQSAAMQATAQKAAQKIANSIQSGQRRPEEAGASGQAPSVTTFDYRKASREQREALKKAIHEASARGEKLYPGR